jgi:hypothetical protein
LVKRNEEMKNKSLIKIYTAIMFMLGFAISSFMLKAVPREIMNPMGLRIGMMLWNLGAFGILWKAIGAPKMMGSIQDE